MFQAVSGAVTVTNFSLKNGFLHYKTRGANKNEKSSYPLVHGFARLYLFCCIGLWAGQTGDAG